MYFSDNSLIDKFYLATCEYLDSGEKLFISNLAIELNVCERDIYRHIKRITGVTPITLINVLRFFGAHELILFSYPIDDIMMKIKIESESYFYKKFKDFFKNTPINIKIKFREDPIYEMIIDNFSVENYNIYFENSLISSQLFYHSQLKRNVADYISSTNFHGIWMRTFFPELVEKYILYNEMNLITKTNNWDNI